MADRTRISTTVDADRLQRARALLTIPDSQLIDRALEALLKEARVDKERRALTAQPYDSDPELTWTAPPGPPLPYDGDIPADVLRLAAERRGNHQS